VAPCRSCVNRRFGGRYRLHLQGRKIRKRGSGVSRWSVHTRSTRYHITEDGILHSHHRKNLKSFIQRKFADLCYNRFIQLKSFRNYESMLNYLQFKKHYCRQQKLVALFLIHFFKNKIDCCSIMDTVGLLYPLSKLEISQPSKSVMSQDLTLKQGASRLQTISANLWTFSINITSPLRIQFPLLNPTELCHYRVTCIILFPRITF
jgi:hypothetical protein